MANYAAYIPALGSTTYPTKLSNFILISEAMDTEVENARGSESSLLDNINLKLSLAGGTMTGLLVAFESTGIDDNATATAITIDASNNTTFAGTIAGTIATAAQPNITSLGTITNFTSTGIDDNATGNAITIDASNNILLADNILERPKLKDYSVSHTTPTISTGAITFDCTLSNSFNVVLTENITTITLSNPPASGSYGEIIIEFIQDATGSRTVSWPVAVKWPGGSAPDITTTATTGKDKIFLSTRDAGTTWLGEYSQDYS
jgi:hypothetical protein